MRPRLAPARGAKQNGRGRSDAAALFACRLYLHRLMYDMRQRKGKRQWQAFSPVHSVQYILQRDSMQALLYAKMSRKTGCTINDSTGKHVLCHLRLRL